MKEEEIFQVAADMPVTERAAYLRTACEGQPALRERVERLLASHDDGGFMQRSADRTDSAELKADLARLKPEEGEDRIGHYKLLQKIGEGGFGTVWMAEQLEPVRRRVALKIIKLGMDTKEVIVRFEQERQALALMDHPNIAKVLDAGATPFGRLFFVMELVRGIRITDFCDQNNLPTPKRLDLFIAVCNAIQHAHQKGIIHRDIKPSNILVTLHDGVPVPKVIDFGVAKAIQAQRLTDLTFFTRFEQMIGTPLYMSPEQAEMSGLDIDTRSDLYSLGVLLYELLTGRTPFDPEKLMKQGLDEMRRAIREDEPQKPSTFVSTMAADVRTTMAENRQVDSVKLIGQIRGDLDWIVMKCLEKDRARRYETANGIAADLKRHLNNELVIARPPSAAYKFQKAWRRNKLIFSAAAAVGTSLVIGISASLWQAVEASRARDKAEHAQVAAQDQRDKAQAAQKLADRNAADMRRNLYAAHINLAQQSWDEGNLAQAQNHLQAVIPLEGDEDLRGYEWRYLRKLCQDESRHTFTNVSFAAERGGLALAADGQTVIAANGNTLKWLDGKHQREMQSVRADTNAIRLLAAPINEPGLIAYCVGSSIKALSPRGETLLGGGVTHESCTAIAWSPDGSVLASGGPDSSLVRWPGSEGAVSTVRLWAGKSGTPIGQPQRLTGDILSLAFSPDSEHLVCGTAATKIHILEVPGLKQFHVLEGHTAFVVALAFDPSGKRLASGSHDSHIILWDFPEGRDSTRLTGHHGAIRDLAFSPDGQQLASGGTDHTVRVWNLATTSVPTLLRGHRSTVKSVLFSADGKEIYSGSEADEVKVWQAPSMESTNVLRHRQWLSQVAFSPAGTFLAAADYHAYAAVLWDLPSRSRIGNVEHHAEDHSNLAFSPNGHLLATTRSNGIVQVTNLSTKEVFEFPKAGYGQSLAFHPSKPILAVGWSNVLFWNTESRTPEDLLVDPPDHDVVRVVFSPDGEQIALGMGDGTVSIWNLASGRKLQSFHQHTSWVTTLCFSHNGSLLASGGADHRITLYDARRLSVITNLDDHSARIGGLAFAPGDKTLVSASWDGFIKFWRLDSRQVALTLVHDGGPVTSVAFSPDQNLMATTGSDGNVRLWPAIPWADIEAKEPRQRRKGKNH